MIKPMWDAKAVKAYETGQDVELVNVPHPHYKPLPEDLNPDALETVEVDLPEIVACKECHLKDTVYDLLDDLKVANLKLSVRSQRTWVGLTDEDLPALAGDNGKVMELQQVRRFAKIIEAKLKERNS
jgi:hypothetical protein